MTTVGAYEAKTHLPELLERVRKGETIMITKHGTPVAELRPVSGGAKTKKTPAEAIADIRAMRKGKRLEGITIKELINEGRKW
jgi:prevent-host-death family protein